MAITEVSKSLNSDVGLTNAFNECMKSKKVDDIKVKYNGKEWTVETKKIEDPHSKFNKIKTDFANFWVLLCRTFSPTYEKKYNAVMLKLDTAFKVSNALSTKSQVLLTKIDSLKKALTAENSQIGVLKNKITDLQKELNQVLEQQKASKREALVTIPKATMDFSEERAKLLQEKEDLLGKVSTYVDKRVQIEDNMEKRKGDFGYRAKAGIGMSDGVMEGLQKELADLNKNFPELQNIPLDKTARNSVAPFQEALRPKLEAIQAKMDAQEKAPGMENVGKPAPDLSVFNQRIAALQQEIEKAQQDLKNLEKEEAANFTDAKKAMQDMHGFEAELAPDDATAKKFHDIEREVLGMHPEAVSQEAPASAPAPSAAPAAPASIPLATTSATSSAPAPAQAQQAAPAAAVAEVPLSKVDQDFLDALEHISTPQMKEVWEGFLKNCTKQKGEVIESYEVKGDTVKVNLKKQVKMYVLSINEKTGKPDPKALPEGGTVLIFGDEKGKMEFTKSDQGKVNIEGFKLNSHLPKIEDLPKNLQGVVKFLLALHWISEWVEPTVKNAQATPTNFNMYVAVGKRGDNKEGVLDNTKKAWSTHSNEDGLLTGNILPDNQDPMDYLKMKRKEYIQKHQIDSKK